MKPGVDLACTGVLPQAGAVAYKVPATSGAVARPDTTSTSAIKRRRVEEVQARQALRTGQCGTNGGDGNRRGVAGQNAAPGHHGFELLEQCLFDLQVFHDGFHHQGGIGQFRDLVDGLQTRTSGLGSFCGELALGRHFFKLGTNALNRLGCRAGAVVEQLDRVPASGCHLGNTGTHGTGADDGNHGLL